MHYIAACCALSFIGIFCSSCARLQGESVPKADQVILIDPEKETPFRLSEMCDSVHYTFLEMVELPVGGINKIIHTNNRFYILDPRTPKIDCFDDTGAFLFQIHHTGRGPGEFIKPVCFTINTEKKQLLAGVSALKKILYYDLDGKYLGEKPLGAYLDNIATLDSNRYLVYDYILLDKVKERSMFNVVSEDFQIISREVPYDRGRHSFGIGFPYFIGDHILTTFAFDYNIYEVRPEKKYTLYPRYYIDFGIHQVAPSLIGSYGQITMENLKLEENLNRIRLVDRIDGAIETADFVIFGFSFGMDQSREDFAKYVVYSKRSGNYRFLNDATNDLNGIDFHEIYYLNDINRFLAILWPYKIQNRQTEFYNIHKDKLDPVKNPVFMTFRLKDF